MSTFDKINKSLDWLAAAFTVGAIGLAIAGKIKRNREAKESGVGEAPFKFRECDRVIVRNRDGEILFEGKIIDYDYNMMSWKKEYTVGEDNGQWHMGVPEKNIELIERASDEVYEKAMRSNAMLHRFGY